VLQSIKGPNAVVVSGVHLLLLWRLVHAGLPAIERRDGAASDAHRILAAEIASVAETERRRIEREARRSRPVAATPRAKRRFPSPPSGPTSTWLTTERASAQLRVSPQRLRRLAAQKRLNTVKGPRGELLFDPLSLAEYAADRAHRSQQAA
jgi:hypothetical protein